MDNTLLERLIKLRRELHGSPELSGEEKETAQTIRLWLEKCSPTRIIENIGGHGIAAVFDSFTVGPSVLFRCELDALPITEIGKSDWQSTIPGKAHLCGHDGHMSIIAGLAHLLHVSPPVRGRVILLFQPAEETGEGARAVTQDKQYLLIKPEYAFALHNLPGMNMGLVGIKPGSFNFASEGLSIQLTGHTSHASHPEDGNSPAMAVTELISKLPSLPDDLKLEINESLITVVHARLGTEDYGISPGEAEVMATVRSIDDQKQTKLISSAQDLAKKIATKYALKIKITRSDRFAACVNDQDATEIMRQALESRQIEYRNLKTPFRWSEDFGVFGNTAKSALCVLGAGSESPQLHHPDYDFPDMLIEKGIDLFEGIIRDICG